MATQQSFEHHTRYVPEFHFVLGTILLVNLVWCAVWLLRLPSWQAGLDLAMAWGFVLFFKHLRYMVTTVQDRVIRLEEQLRMQRLLPDGLKSRIGEFTTPQLVALRFASDTELPALARRVLDEKLTRKRDIKALIQTWRPDELRA